MSIDAKIGETLNLETLIPDDGRIMIGLGWEKKRALGPAHDLDSVVFMVGSDNKCQSGSDVCFYKEGFRTQHNGAVIHFGDDNNGSGVGDDEKVEISLNLIPERIKALIVVVSIHNAVKLGQNFGQVEDAWVRLANAKTGEDLVTYDLVEDATTSTAVEFARIERSGNSWTFTALGKGTQAGLPGIMEKYGFTVKQ